ncbi:MAG: nucleotidyltransferase domain-containing protein [Lachnospiraceae bacterium]|nr:nucleotidyltransferase domain-containing protein [Lachnospiraceae bacterium]
MIYSIEEISLKIRPVAEKYHLKAIYLFGSYARGEAREDSDVDLLVDTSGADLDSLFKLGGLYSDLEDALKKTIDLVTMDSIMQKPRMKSDISFRNNIMENKVDVYVAA